GRLFVFLSNGDGSFQPPIESPAYPFFSALGDFDGDGKYDFFMARLSSPDDFESPSSTIHLFNGTAFNEVASFQPYPSD
ncbi:hypothetical protein DKP78_25575, partial [Enterococcus faecium]